MNEASKFAVRRWIPRSSSELTLDDGFFPANADEESEHESGSTFELAIGSNCPCIVLLGPPGIGKTTEFARIKCVATERGHAIRLAALSSVGTAEELESIFLETLARAQIDVPAILLLDSLDEGFAAAPTVQQWLVKAVKRALAISAETNQHLLLRISSRSADWSTQLEELLRGLYGKDSVQVFELAPLTRAQAIAYVQSTTGQHDQFFEALKETDTEVLASRPVTLQMLLRSFAEDGSVSNSKVAIYRRGVLALLEESNLERRASGWAGELSTEQRFAIAARIAAASVLSTKRTIWDGLHYDATPKTSIAVSELVGEIEEAFGDSVRVNARHIRETLRTGLFRARTSEQFEWVHGTFAEFLAAYYMTARVVDAPKSLELVRSGMPTNNRVVPQLREVAAWLGIMNASIRDQLVISEPEVLLSSDVALSSLSDRRALVDQYLGKLRAGVIYDKFEWRSHYQRLDHPELASQLAPIIRDTSNDVILRRTAIDIAEACKRGELVADLMAVAEDQTDEPHIRAQAAHALTLLLTSGRIKELRELAFNTGPDPYDEIKGWLLMALWPNYMSAGELFPLLTPPREESFIGAYALFLHDLEIGPVTREDASVALAWITEQMSSEIRDRHFAELIPRVLVEVWKNAEDPKVIETLADIVLLDPIGARLRHESDLSSFEKAYRCGPSDQRRRLLLAIFAAAPNDWKHARLLSYTPWAIVAIDDLPWLTNELIQPIAPQWEHWLIEVITSVITWEPNEQIRALWDLPHEGLRRALEALSFVPLDSDLAIWHREQKKRAKRKSEKPKVESREDTISDLLTRTETGDQNAFWLLNLALLRDDGGRVDEFTGDLTASAGWEALNDAGRTRVIDAAKRFIDSYVLPEGYLQPNTHNRPAAAGYRAFRLLFGQQPDSYGSLSEAVWARWSLALLSFSSNDAKSERENQGRIIEDCFRITPQSVALAIRHILSVTESFNQIIDLLGDWAPDLLWDVVWDRAATSGLKDDEYERVLEPLAIRGYLPAVELAEQSLNALHSDAGAEPTVRALHAAALYIRIKPSSSWDKLKRIIETNADVGRALLLQLVGAPTGGRSLIEVLDEMQQAQLFAWIESIFQRPKRLKGAYFVTPIDALFDLQQSILNSLVNRGTTASVAAVNSLAERFPEIAWLRWSLEDARESQRRVEWVPPSALEALERIVGRQFDRPLLSEKETIIDAAALSASLSGPREMIDLQGVVAEDVPLATPSISMAAAPASKLTILCVNDEWGSGHGGISTFNRHLCISLTRHGHSVFCFIPDPTERDVAEAGYLGVTVVSAQGYPGLSRTELLARGPKRASEIKPNIVIGHDQVTGAYALALARDVFDCPYLHFIHSSPEELEPLKETKEKRDNDLVDYVKSASKGKLQIDVCAMADAVLTIGPKLYRHIRTNLDAIGSNLPIVQVMPGFNDELLQFKKPSQADLDFYCFLSGRLDETVVKGTDLFVRIASEFDRRSFADALGRTRFIMRGFREDTMNEHVKALCRKNGAARDNITARPYETDEKLLLGELRAASIFLMPSKSEGFGLTGLDAIAAGIPVIVSSQSGLGQTLAAIADGLHGNLKTIARNCVLDVRGNEEMVRSWVDAVASLLGNPAKAFSDANDLRDALRPTFNWVETVSVITAVAEKAIEQHEAVR